MDIDYDECLTFEEFNQCLLVFDIDLSSLNKDKREISNHNFKTSF